MAHTELTIDLLGRELLAIAVDAAGQRSREALAEQAAEAAAGALTADWVALAHIDHDGVLVARQGSRTAPHGAVIADAAAVSAAGLATGQCHRLPGLDGPLDAVVVGSRGAEPGVLVAAFGGSGLGASSPNSATSRFLVELAALLEVAFERIRVDHEIASSEERLAEAQQMAGLGSYDWHIPTDTNTWSDELYRIYGHEPGAFNASYERFLSMIHPDDRERIMAIHAKAMQDHQPYRMEERIVRPDGEIRILDSSGKVVLDEHGRPLRMAGICLDVTEQRQAAEALARSQARFRDLVESAPDAVILFDADGCILQANRQTEVLFGWPVQELAGLPVERLLPEEVRRSAGLGLDLRGVRRDGAIVDVDVSLARIDTDEGPATAAFVRDATARKLAAEADRRLAQAEDRRRQALEINDNVVQGLTSVVAALEIGWVDAARGAAQATLASAGVMMSELLGVSDEELSPGDLVRTRRAPAALPAEKRTFWGAYPGDDAPGENDALTVLLADDSDDLRALYRLMLSRQGITVVAEAGDGRQAVELARRHRPDVAVLDLAMPGLDGLQATAEIKRALPDCRVVILSGFEEGRVGAQARIAGVDRYLAKGIDAASLAAALFEIGPARAHPAAPPPPSPSASEPDAVEELLHELRTPLSVVAGVAATLVAQAEQLPASDARDLLERMERNTRHLGRLIAAYSEMRRLRAGQLRLYPELIDFGELVRECVADLDDVLAGRAVEVVAAEPVRLHADPLRLRQIVTNLLSNAGKFGTVGTPVRVNVRALDRGAELAVSNVGPDISPADRARLFRPFERLGAGGGGTGLGLSISRALAQAHGGTLELAPGGNGLTTFVLRLPRSG